MLDDFDRADNVAVGNGWTEEEGSPSTASIVNNMLNLSSISDTIVLVHKTIGNNSGVPIYYKAKYNLNGGGAYVFRSLYNAENSGTTLDIGEGLQSSVGANILSIIRGVGTSSADFILVKDTWYYIGFIYDLDAGIIRSKAWLTTDDEPGWMANYTGVSPNYEKLVFQLYGGLNGDSWLIDWVYNGTFPVDYLNVSKTEPINESEFSFPTIDFNISVNATYEFNATLFINNSITTFTLNSTNKSYAPGQKVKANFTLNFVEGDYQYYFEITDTFGNVRTSNVTTFYVDTLIPTISYVNPVNQPGNVSRFNLTTNISVSDTNLYWINYTVWYWNGSLLYNFSFNRTDDFTGFDSYEIQSSVNFTTEGNYTISVEAIDSHTYGTLNGLKHYFDNTGITLYKNLMMKKIEIGSFKNGKFKVFEQKDKDDYKIKNSATNKSYEYDFDLEYEKKVEKLDLAYAIPKGEDITLINANIGHFLWRNGFDGYYFDFTDIIEGGNEITYSETDEYHIIYVSNTKCKIKGEKCEI